MIVPGLLMLLMAFFYYRYTKDTPAGNYDEIDRKVKIKTKTDYSVLKDWRVWALALAYAVCFGMEITFDNVAALYFVQEYKLDQSSAGFWAGVFGFMNLFARALGGIFADKIGRSYGLRGKGLLLAAVLLLEGAGLIMFASAGSFGMAIFSMITFALFLKMANGATYAITPFINEKNVGLVSGIVGAGGNAGGMLFGFLFKSKNITYLEAFRYIGMIAIVVALLVLITRFAKEKTEKKTGLSPVIANP
jgi:NNP family nitrate/nitrite transporter-like MFS transporter